jgi:exoribonuclease-2
MSESIVRYPGPGCIVEYMEGNRPRIAWISGEQSGKMRLLLPNRREMSLASARLLPWAGPTGSATLSKDAAVALLERHAALREERCLAVDAPAVWEAAQGEVELAGAQWFAELFESRPDADTVAAYGRALLACKSHFKFQPPEFLLYSEESVKARLLEQEAQRRRDKLARDGAEFMRLLWDVHCKKRALPPPDGPELPDEETCGRLREMILARLADPEACGDESLWRLLCGGLPDLPHLPLHLAGAWGLVPEHHNFWLDRAAYAPGDAWSARHAPAVAALREDCCRAMAGLPFVPLPFVSIDGETTRDVDDAFHVEELPDGRLRLHLALACPALCWPFGSELDKEVLRRATSIYLPEGTHHMLPEELGTDFFSLAAGEERPALYFSCEADGEGKTRSGAFSLCRAVTAANLNFADCEAVLLGGAEADNAAGLFAEQLFLADRFAGIMRRERVRRGAVIMERPEPVFRLEGEGENLKVLLEENPPRRSQNLVAEMMILSASAAAAWASERALPFLYRTQDVALPAEYAGVWTQPHDMARIMKSLIPSCLELSPRPHAALGAEAYSPVSSPLRRYSDLINEAQLLHMLARGVPLRSSEELAALLPLLNARLEAAGQVQRFRPRYWKLFYLRGHGDRTWWDGVVTEENDAFVSVILPREQIFIRGRRKLFGDRVYAGQAVRVRLGKIDPLLNEVSILETEEP